MEWVAGFVWNQWQPWSGIRTATAGPIQLDFQGPSYGSFDNGIANGSNTYAGQFDFDVQDSTDPLEAFCIDLDATLIQSLTEYEFKTSDQYFSDSPGIVTSLDRLYSTYYDEVGDSKTSAAFQLGIWEILADTGVSYDLSDGGFTASSYSTGADTLAQTWLENLGLATGYQFLVADSTADPESQDLLVVNPPPQKVPEPGSLTLVGLGLAGLALRKRKA